jgi:hypothetical protein
MQEMMTTMMRTGGTVNTHSHQRNQRANRGRGGAGRNNDNFTTVNRGRGQPGSPHPYCWSHEMCAHSSDVCNTKMPAGHQVTAATIHNMQEGGSTNKCFWIQPST